MKVLLQVLNGLYEKALEPFLFSVVHKLPPQKFTNLGVFAKFDCVKALILPLNGVLSRLPSNGPQEPIISFSNERRLFDARASIFC